MCICPSAGPGLELRGILDDLIRRCPKLFNLNDIDERYRGLYCGEDDGGSGGPYCIVAMQECARMNILISKILGNLDECLKGLNGQLNMSEDMDQVISCLKRNEVPGRNIHQSQGWESIAWPSRKSLGSWYNDFLLRVAQLESWSRTLTLPFSVWLPGLVNPQGLLTAIKQVTARRNSLPLDFMTLDTHATRMYKVTDASVLGIYPVDGIFIHGLYLEGARWCDDSEAADSIYTVNGMTCAGHLKGSRLKQLLHPMPVIYVQAVQAQPTWTAESVGYLRGDKALYECPVYLTSARGSTFVFLSTLRTVSPQNQERTAVIHRGWILAGVALLMQSDD
jgi:dynein heavy chain